MAPHMRTQRIRAGMRLTFAGAIHPLARVPLLSDPDMLVVDMLHQAIHIAEVTCRASIPHTHGYLIAALAAVVVLLRVAAQRSTKEERRVRDLAGGIGGDGGCGRGWRGGFVLD